jgi:hypothetical protein
MKRGHLPEVTGISGDHLRMEGGPRRDLPASREFALPGEETSVVPVGHSTDQEVRMQRRILYLLSGTVIFYALCAGSLLIFPLRAAVRPV